MALVRYKAENRVQVRKLPILLKIPTVGFMCEAQLGQGWVTDIAADLSELTV